MAKKEDKPTKEVPDQCGPLVKQHKRMAQGDNPPPPSGPKTPA